MIIIMCSWHKELEIEESTPAVSVRVDIATSGSSQVYESSKTEHQRSVLQQYAVDSEERISERAARSIHHYGDTKPATSTGRNVQEKQDRHQTGKEGDVLTHYNHQKEMELSAAEESSFCGASFQVPTPQLHLSEVWETSKSFPSRALSSSRRPHSCHHNDVQRQASKMDAHVPPSSSPMHHPALAPPTATPTDPTVSESISTLSLKSILDHTTPSQSAESAVSGTGYQPVMYNAWTTAKSSAPNTRHTVLTSSRLMSK